MAFEMPRLLKNRDFILLLGLALGLAAGGGARWTHQAILPALGMVMTLSTLGISAGHFRSPRRLLTASLWGLGLCYVLLAGLLLLASRLFADDPALRDGLVILAAAPPAVAVIPFCEFLGGDRPFILLATIGAYLGALVLMPAIAAWHWGAGMVSPWDLLRVLFLLVLLPVAAGRVLRFLGWEERLNAWKGPLTNWGFFVVVYSIVGLNRDFIFDHPGVLLPLAGVALATTFGLGLVIELAGRLAGMRPERVQSIVLLGTLKNYGLSGGLAVALFSQRTALPAVVFTTTMIVFVIWLGWLNRWLKRG